MRVADWTWIVAVALIVPATSASADDTVIEGELEASGEYDEAGFCGVGIEYGDDFYEALERMEYGDYRGANQVLVSALRRGRIRGYERAPALAFLAETQVQLGRYANAIRNYRKVLRLDPYSSYGAKPGLALALALAGRDRGASRVAHDYVYESCDDVSVDVGCFAAYSTLATVAPRQDERQQAAAQAERLYAAAHESIDQPSYDTVRALLDRRADVVS